MSLMEDFYATREVNLTPQRRRDIGLGLDEVGWQTEWIRLLNRDLNPAAPVINTSVLVDTFRWVDKHPRLYDQRTWGERRRFGRNVHCFAGHIARRAGAKFDWSTYDYDEGFLDCKTPDGRTMFTGDYAIEVAGLTYTQGQCIFSEWANRELIRDRIREWTGVDPA